MSQCLLPPHLLLLLVFVCSSGRQEAVHRHGVEEMQRERHPGHVLCLRTDRGVPDPQGARRSEQRCVSLQLSSAHMKRGGNSSTAAPSGGRRASLQLDPSVEKLAGNLERVDLWQELSGSGANGRVSEDLRQLRSKKSKRNELGRLLR